MATYEEIYGKRVKEFDSDPTLDSSYEGQVWYDKSSGTLRSVVTFGAWASSSPTIQDQKYAVQVGTQTSALIFASGPSGQTYTEEYNGLGWTSGGALGTGRYQSSGFGTQTAAVCAAGDKPPASPAFRGEVEEYDGTSWSEVNNVSTARYALTGLGILTAGAIIGGRESGSPAPYSNKTENYDGTNWTTGGTYPISVQNVATGGPQTSSFAVGGYTGSNSNVTANYDGSSWTASGNANTARTAGGGAGSQTDGLFFAGNDGSASNKTENYDGSSWTNNPATLGSARNSLGGSGTSTAALATGGFPAPPGTPKLTEEFTQSINTITAAAWSSGSLMGTGRYQGNGQNVGTQTAGMYSGGQGSYPSTAPAVTVSNVEEYDGSSWSEVTNLPESKAMFGAVGTQTAAFVFGGYGGPGAGPNPAPGGSPKSTALNYDGTNWTASPYSLPSAVAYLTGAGTSTAALSIGGHPALTTCNEYDGEGWTSGGSMTTGRNNSSAFGILTAAIVAGGAPGASVEVDAESYNGTSWTAAANLIVNKGQAGTAGTQTDGLVFLGNAANPTNTIGWNGTSWFTQPSTSTARYGGTNGSTSVASAYYAGGGGSASGTLRQTTEEFTAESSVITASTLTSS